MIAARVLSIVFCGFVVATAGRVRAEDACRVDAEKICRGVRPGGGRIIRCLQEHEAELSPACRSQFAAGREKAAAFKTACGADAQKLCADVKPGGGRVVQCLRSHEGELSDACRGAITK